MTKKRGSKERGKKARNLGALAEDMFSYFATQLDLIATKSQRDWEGWDLASDIPDAVIDPWGLPTPPLICRFQIKATETAKRTVRLRRENILRMAQQPIPWFVMLVRYSKRSAQKIDLVHIGKDVVEDVLRWAITEPKATGFQLACDARGLEIEPTPDAWFAAIEREIGEKSSYLTRKAEWNDNAGRSQPRFQFNIKSRSNTVDEMADFFLGLAPSMKVDSATIYEERFGIRRLRQDIGEGKMEIDPLAPSARVSLTARSPHQVASVDCQLFSTYPWIPISFGHRVRLRMKYFDMVLASEDDKTRVVVSPRSQDTRVHGNRWRACEASTFTRRARAALRVSRRDARSASAS